MLSREKAEKFLDVLLQVLHVVDDLVGDKLLPAEVALAGVKAALAGLDDDRIETITPDEIRGIAKALRETLAERDASKVKKLHDKFDVEK